MGRGGWIHDPTGVYLNAQLQSSTLSIAGNNSPPLRRFIAEIGEGATVCHVFVQTRM